MTPSLDRLFLDYSDRKLGQLAHRIHDCLGRLTSEQIWDRAGENSNAVGNLVLHLCGNMRQWIGSGVGRLPDHRDRDAEFAAQGEVSGSELSARLHATFAECLPVLQSLTPERLAETITVQNYDITVLEAIYHVVEHFAQHTGQIVFATKQFTDQNLGYYAHLTAARPRQDQTP